VIPNTQKIHRANDGIYIVMKDDFDAPDVLIHFLAFSYPYAFFSKFDISIKLFFP
jgi:hypothetical protein